MHLPLLVAIGAAAVLVGAVMHLRGRRASPAFVAALVHIQHSADAADLLGEPIVAGLWVQGELTRSRARLRIPLSGASADGEALAVAYNTDDGWALSSLTLTRDGAAPVNLLAVEAPHAGPAAAALHSARALTRAERYAEALHALDEVSATEPGLAEGWRLRGRALAALRRDGAEDAFLRAIELDDSDPQSHSRLGMLYFQRGQHADCADAYSGALSIVPRDSRVWYNRAVCQMAAGSTDEGLRGAQIACDLGSRAACRLSAAR